jgi:hypothetical protein
LEMDLRPLGSAAQMSIKFEPDKLLKKIAPESKIKKMLTKKLTLKKAALRFIDAIDFIDKSKVVDVALKTVKSYKDRIAKARDESAAAGKVLKDDLIDDPKQLIQRVQNEVVFQIHDEIKKSYGGRTAVWLPSSANEPRPEHQLNYGKEYEIGVGIDGVEPGDEYGCQCGVEIKGDETQLEI